LRGRKKINLTIGQLKEVIHSEKGQVRLFFEDEASFGRISDTKHCWCAKGVRPVIHKQRVREYREIFGAVEPETGDFVYMIEQKGKPEKKKPGRPKKGEVAESKKPKQKEKGKKSRLMNEFMQMLSERYSRDRIVCCLDHARWHTSQYIRVPTNITLIFIPPYTPEMNPIEQIWREIRTMGFHNRYFNSLAEVIAHLQTTIATLSPKTVMSITQRDWIMNRVQLDAA